MKIINRIINYWIDTYFLFKKDLQQNNWDIKNDISERNYCIRAIESVNDSSISSIVSLWKKAYPVEIEDAEKHVRALLQDGDVCFGVFQHNKIAGMAWSGQAAAIQRIGFAHLLKGEGRVGLGHHDFIDSIHRGAGLQRALIRARFNYAATSGCQIYYIVAGVKNFASIKNLMREFTQYKMVIHLKIDIPFCTINLFPGLSRENWESCGVR